MSDYPRSWEAIRQTVPCPDCNGDEWMAEPEDDFPGWHCGACADGYIDMLRLLAVGAAVFSAEPSTGVATSAFLLGYDEGSNDRLSSLRSGQP